MENFPDAIRFDPYANGFSSGHSDLATLFLGPGAEPDKKSPYSMRSVAKWNYPESKIGEVEYLRETMEDWMFTADKKWYTERILPWRKMDTLTYAWEQWEANPHIMGYTPHQAMSNVTTQKRTQMAATLIRRGIAAEFEQDFLTTQVGRGRFLATLVQIARSVQETANVETIRALLACHRHQQLFARQYHHIRDNDLDNYWQRKVDRFMVAQKADFGLEQLSVQIDGELEDYGINVPMVWIMGREVSDYCDTVPEGKIYYDKGGQEAVDRINGRRGIQAAGGTNGNVAGVGPERWVKGTPVFLAKSWAVENVGKADLLSRTIEVGVFNTILLKCKDFKKYRSADMNIRVYDNTKDDWAEITFEKAIEHCILWDKNDDWDVADPYTGTRRGRVGGTETEQKMDFLRYGTGEAGDAKQDVKYIGDLDDTWLTTKQTLNAAQTLLNAVQRTVKETSNLGFDISRPTFDSKTNKYSDVTTVQTPKDDADVIKFLTTAGNILGKDSLFFNTTADMTSATGPHDLINKFINTPGKYATKSIELTNAPISSDVSSYNKTEAEQAHQKWLRQIGGYIPDNKKDALEAIVTNSSETWKQRALNIQALALECKKNDPPSISMNTDRIKTWTEGRINEYQAEFNQWIKSQATMSAPVGDNVVYLPIGTPLPQGYTYLNAQEEAKAKSGAAPTLRCPTSLAEFTHIAEVFEGSGGGATNQRGVGISGRRGASLVGARGQSEDTDKNMGRGEYTIDPKTGAQTEIAGKRTERLKRRYNNIDRRIRAIAYSSATVELKWLAILYLGTRFNKLRFHFLADQDVLLPVQFLLLRPHCTYRTRYAIKCADNGVAGFFAYGASSMNVAHSASVKTRLMHYTAYMAPVVTNPKMVYVQEDVFCTNYFGGMGTEFWSLDEYNNKGANRTKRSIICTMLPLNMPYDMENKIDIRGYWYSAAAAKLVDAERFSRGCYPGGDRTAALCQWWDPVRKGALGNQVARSRNVAINYVCFQGVQFRYNSKNDTWGDVTIEQGHFGPDVLPGCGKVRKGAFKFLKPASYVNH